MLAEVFLELAKQACRKAGLMLEVHVVEAPLVLEERLQVLNKGGREPLELEPFGVGRSESEEVTGLAWVVGAVHVGVKKDARVCGELELIQCKNVVAIDGGGVRILQECAKVATCTG